MTLPTGVLAGLSSFSAFLAFFFPADSWAFQNFSRPSSVTLVQESPSSSSFVSPFRCTSPASVMLVLLRFSISSSVSPFRCTSPASVISLKLRYSFSSLVSPFRRTSPASVMLVSLRSSSLSTGNSSRCTRSASVTLVSERFSSTTAPFSSSVTSPPNFLWAAWAFWASSFFFLAFDTDFFSALNDGSFGLSDISSAHSPMARFISLLPEPSSARATVIPCGKRPLASALSNSSMYESRYDLPPCRYTSSGVPPFLISSANFSTIVGLFSNHISTFSAPLEPRFSSTL